MVMLVIPHMPIYKLYILWFVKFYQKIYTIQKYQKCQCFTDSGHSVIASAALLQIHRTLGPKYAKYVEVPIRASHIARRAAKTHSPMLLPPKIPVKSGKNPFKLVPGEIGEVLC